MTKFERGFTRRYSLELYAALKRRSSTVLDEFVQFPD
jgi:hypothetical protein